MAKDYIGNITDMTGDSYLNPVPAIYDNGTHNRSESQITSISIHHDASVRPHDYNDLERYYSEAKEHYQRLGPGIQYHYKISNLGDIYKLRPHTLWTYNVGSAENVTTLAICLDGYFHAPHNQKPTREQYEALSQLLVFLCEQQPQFPATYPDVRPHRDYSSTACPGDTFAPWVFAVQDKASATSIPADAVYDWPEYQPTYTPPTPPPNVTPEPIPVPTPPVVPEVKPEVPTTPPEPKPTEQTPCKPTAQANLLQAMLDAIVAFFKSIFK